MSVPVYFNDESRIAEHQRAEGLRRIDRILQSIEPVRQILRLIARQSRDEYACEQAEEALRILEVPDGSS